MVFQNTVGGLCMSIAHAINLVRMLLFMWHWPRVPAGFSDETLHRTGTGSATYDAGF